MTEDVTICSTKGPDCQNAATIRSFWPGNDPALVCAACAHARESISKAMGFHLHQEPIEPSELTDEHPDFILQNEGRD